jgi:hypothetical protein
MSEETKAPEAKPEQKDRPVKRSKAKKKSKEFDNPALEDHRVASEQWAKDNARF